MIGERAGTSENERVSLIASELVLGNVNGSKRTMPAKEH